MILDGDRVVVSRAGVPTDKIEEVVTELQQATAPGLRVVVARDLTEPLAPVPRPEESPSASAAAAGELAGAELAHHMLWESFKRSCQVQGYMLDKMTGCAVEMNRRFIDEMETMRGKYKQALEKIDGLEFEQKMLEHEAASRHLSSHYVRMAEEELRATERRRSEQQSVIEQIARGVLRVVTLIGDDSIHETH